MDDYTIALLLQQEYNDENTFSDLNDCYSIAENTHKKSRSNLSIVDDQWELIDPNPDIRGLFIEFNNKFFEGRLSGIEVKWSPRMTCCAGLCCYEGQGGLCSIRLSLPLLKLRPRRDMVETLLHEMIHAYLFVTHNNKDRDDHGPEFLKHMFRINKETGAKLTVYHSFHDEVDLYRQHWWRCNGPCQKRSPYFGFVRRSMNRAPSSNDSWWANHQLVCGGTFTKIKEPDGYKAKPSKRKDESAAKNDGKAKMSKVPGNDLMRAQVVPTFTGKGNILGGSSSHSHLVDSLPSSSGVKPNIKQHTLHNFTNKSNSNYSTSGSFSSDGSKSLTSHKTKTPPSKKVKGHKTFEGIQQSQVSSNKPDHSAKTTATIPHFFNKTLTKTVLHSTHSNGILPEKKLPKFEQALFRDIIHEHIDNNHLSTCDTISPHCPGDQLSVKCPICKTSISATLINEHLDTCLQLSN